MAINLDIPEAEWYDKDSPYIEELVREVTDVRELAVDTETTGLNNVSDVPLFWSMSWGERRICLHANTLPFFKKALEDPHKRIIGANVKFDAHMLANVGIHLRGDLHDIQVMHSLLFEERSHRLKDITKEVLGWTWRSFEDVFNYKSNGKLTQESAKEDVVAGGSFGTIQDAILWCYHNDKESLVEYASNDAYGTMQNFLKLRQMLQEDNIYSLFPEMLPTMWDYYMYAELPFTRVLWKCERHGIYVDQEYLDSIKTPVTQELERIHRRINKEAGRIIKPNSPKDLERLLYDDLKLPCTRRTKGGKTGVRNRSTDAEALEALAPLHPVAQMLLQYRELDKLLSTYVKGLDASRDSRGRIHTTFGQHIVRTGRLSSSNPNCQNIPNPENDKFKIRKAFTITPNSRNKLLVADYDTLEMRLLACASMEESMIEMIRSGKDIHMGNATLVFGGKDGFDYAEIAAAKKAQSRFTKGELKESDITERMHHLLQRRKQVKTIGFGQRRRQAEVKLPQNGELFVAEAA